MHGRARPSRPERRGSVWKFQCSQRASEMDYFSSSVDLSFCSVLLGGPLRFSRVNIRIERWPGEEGGRPGSWFKLFCASAAA